MKKICEDCSMNRKYHVFTWLNDFTASVLNLDLVRYAPRWLRKKSDLWIENFFLALRLLQQVFDFEDHAISARSIYLVRSARERGYRVAVLKSPFGLTNFFRLTRGTKIISFEGLPSAAFMDRGIGSKIDDKNFVKKELAQHGFPTLAGKSFSLFSKHQAVVYGKNLGYPLVVKPRSGSFSRHITLRIQNKEKLGNAIDKALQYSPFFVVEKFLDDAWVVRATVVDQKNVALVKRVPPNVIGDGKRTLAELIAIKNADPKRGNPDDETKVTYKIAPDPRIMLDRIPQHGERVFLRSEPFIRLGADLEDVTHVAHSETVQLCRDVARHFSVRLVGIDFLCKDIAVSYKHQSYAILELNSLPCIEIHHEPTLGSPVDVSGWLLDMMEKYY